MPRGIYKHKSNQGFQKKHKSFISNETYRKISEKLKGNKNGFKKGHKINIGEKNGSWKGGKSFELYGRDWTDILKISIRERDGYICQLCGIHQEELTKNEWIKILDIHHIDYDKQNNNPNNLISLCRYCHMKTNFNRENWIKVFKSRK